MIAKTVNIGVDLDGVVTNFVKRFSEICNTVYGSRCPIITNDEDVKGYNWHEWYPMTEEEATICFAHAKKIYDFWATLECIDDVGFNLLKMWISTLPRSNVYFITNRFDTAGTSVVKQSIQWLKMHGWKDPQVLSLSDKGNAVKNLQITHFIDDKTQNLIDVKSKNPDCFCYIRDMPHNRSLTSEQFIRVSNLSEFVDILMKNEYYTKKPKTA